MRKLDNRSGFIDLFWPGVLIVEQKSAGRDLARAYGQAGEYFDSLSERDRPRYILVSDFQTFELHDLDEGEHITFPLADLHDHVEEFGFILGVQRRTFRDQDPVNVEASASMGRLHDALKVSGYGGHDLEVFLVRTVFCLLPTTPASLSHATSSWTCWKPGPAKTAQTSAVGSRGCSRC